MLPRTRADPFNRGPIPLVTFFGVTATRLVLRAAYYRSRGLPCLKAQVARDSVAWIYLSPVLDRTGIPRASSAP